jgi:hypothetical protein
MKDLYGLACGFCLLSSNGNTVAAPSDLYIPSVGDLAQVGVQRAAEV